MDYVDGLSLEEFELPKPVSEVVEILRELGRLVAIMHDGGIIHRDLHLGNVMSTKKGLVIFDFGLARTFDRIDEYKTFRPVGAMSHCAPEKWLKPSDAGRQSDVFSLGVMAYRLLTGRHPFWADTYIGLYETIRAGEFLPPSARRRQIPQTIDWVVGAMLQPSPELRLADARSVVQALEHFEATVELRDRAQTHRPPLDASSEYRELVAQNLGDIAHTCGLNIEWLALENPLGLLFELFLFHPSYRGDRVYVLPIQRENGIFPLQQVLELIEKGPPLPLILVTDIPPPPEIQIEHQLAITAEWQGPSDNTQLADAVRRCFGWLGHSDFDST